MSAINPFTIRTTPDTGETVFTNILLNGGSIPVNDHRLPITSNLFGTFGTLSVNGQTFLTRLERGQLPKTFPSVLDWEEEVFIDGRWEIEKAFREPIVAMVLLKARCKTNVRCPLPRDYWRAWVKAGDLRSDETAIVKNELRAQYPRNFDIRDSGCYVILPDVDPIYSRKEYLILMANKGSFEWVFDRTDGRPNTYRVECNDGEISLIDPRREITIMMEEEEDARTSRDF